MAAEQSDSKKMNNTVNAAEASGHQTGRRRKKNEKNQNRHMKYSQQTSPLRSGDGVKEQTAPGTEHQDIDDSLEMILVADHAPHRSLLVEHSNNANYDLPLDKNQQEMMTQLQDVQPQINEQQIAHAHPSVMDTPPMSFSLNQDGRTEQENLDNSAERDKDAKE